MSVSPARALQHATYSRCRGGCRLLGCGSSKPADPASPTLARNTATTYFEFAARVAKWCSSGCRPAAMRWALTFGCSADHESCLISDGSAVAAWIGGTVQPAPAVDVNGGQSAAQLDHPGAWML